MSFKCLTPLGPFGKNPTGVTKKLSLCVCRNINPPCYVRVSLITLRNLHLQGSCLGFPKWLKSRRPGLPRLRILSQIPPWLSTLEWRDHTMPGVPVVPLPCKVRPYHGVMGDCHGGLWCQQGFEIPAAVKSISVGLASSSCVSLRIPREA